MHGVSAKGLLKKASRKQAEQ